MAAKEGGFSSCVFSGKTEDKKVYAVNADKAVQSYSLVLIYVGQTPNNVSILFPTEQIILCRCLSTLQMSV